MAGSLPTSHGRFGEGQIRVGDAERDGALAALREHYAQGRLDAAELDERISAALVARTRGELARLFTDLPGERRAWPPASRTAPDPWSLVGRLFGAATVSALVVGLIVAVAFVALLVTAVAVGGFLWIVLCWWLLARGVGRGCGRRRGRMYLQHQRYVTRA